MTDGKGIVIHSDRNARASTKLLLPEPFLPTRNRGLANVTVSLRMDRKFRKVSFWMNGSWLIQLNLARLILTDLPVNLLQMRAHIVPGVHQILGVQGGPRLQQFRLIRP